MGTADPRPDLTRLSIRGSHRYSWLSNKTGRVKSGLGSGYQAKPMTIADAECWNDFVCHGCGVSVQRPSVQLEQRKIASGGLSSSTIHRLCLPATKGETDQ